jgi:hypothetical protein
MGKRKAEDIKKRLTLGPDFNISRRISAEARTLSERPGSPGFTIPLYEDYSIPGRKYQLESVRNINRDGQDKQDKKIEK